MSWRKYLLLPQLIWPAVRSASYGGDGETAAWDRYWGAIRRTGPTGEVLWDAGSEAELRQSLVQLGAHADPTLPVVDIGCGNGRYTRALAARFPRVLGIDVAPHAVERARAEAGATASVAFRTLDATAPGVGQRLAAELGEANVHIRGVLHVLDDAGRRGLVQNVRELLGRRGVLYLLETASPGGPLDYLERLGARPWAFPATLRRLLTVGLRPPGHFGDREYRTYFPDREWETLACGAADMYTLSVRTGHEPARVPGFFAVARARPPAGR